MNAETLKEIVANRQEKKLKTPPPEKGDAERVIARRNAEQLLEDLKFKKENDSFYE